MSDAIPGVSIVIPARDEEAAIGAVLTNLVAALGGSDPIPHEIIVVDDGSVDSTGKIARLLGARLVALPESLGYGAAVKKGIRAATHDAVVILDGDGTYPAERVRDLVSRLMAGADQVIGARVGDDVQIPLLRRPAKQLVTRFASWLTGRRIVDLNSGMRAFRRSAVGPLLPVLPDGFSLTTTLTVAGLLSGWTVEWVAIAYARRQGSSKFRAFRDTARLMLSLIRAVVYSSPLRVFLPITAALATAALACAGWDVFIEANLTDKTVLFSLSAVEVFVLGLLADLIVRRR